MKEGGVTGAIVCLLLVGCSSSANDMDGGSDASSGVDSSAMNDSSTTMDAGTDSNGGMDSGGTMDSGGMVAPGTIQGMVVKGPNLTFKGDGKGTLWVDIGNQCPYSMGINVQKTITVMNVDLTPNNAMVPFTMTGVAAGTYYVWGWLDDNGDNQPFPMGGDPGNNPVCPQVTLTAQAGASVTLSFNSSNWN